MKNKIDYKAIFKNSPEVIAFADPEGTILDLNKRIFDWVGYRPEELIGKKYSELEFFAETTKELLIKKHSQRVSGEDMQPYKIELISKDGKKFAGQFVAKLIKMNNGSLRGILVMISDITRQYEETQTYQDLSKRNQALIQAIPDLIFVMKRDGTYVDFKADPELELAVPRNEIIGKNIINSGFSEENLKLIENNVKEAFLTGNVQTFEYEIIMSDGIHTFECRMVSLNAGEVLSIIRDITWHKQVNEELRLKNIVFETSIVANSTADINGNLTFVNQSFLDTWGYNKKSEVIGRPISDFFIKSEEADRVFRGLNNIGIWRGDFLGKKKDGSSFVCQGFASVVHDSAGNFIGYQSTNEDISEKRRSDEALRDSEKRYKALFENNTDPIFIFDLDGIHLEANLKAHEMLGYSPGGITGRHFSEFTTERESDASRKKFLSLLDGEILPVYERTFVKKDGTEFPAEINISLIYDNEGKPEYFQSIVRELSREK